MLLLLVRLLGSDGGGVGWEMLGWGVCRVSLVVVMVVLAVLAVGVGVRFRGPTLDSHDLVGGDEGVEAAEVVSVEEKVIRSSSVDGAGGWVDVVLGGGWWD